MLEVVKPEKQLNPTYCFRGLLFSYNSYFLRVGLYYVYKDNKSEKSGPGNIKLVLLKVGL